MALIYYYISLKFYLLFNPHKNFWGFIALFGMVLISILYGRGFAELLNGNLFLFNESVYEKIKLGLLVLVATFTFFRGFFPTYKPVPSLFKKFHPLNSRFRFILNYLSDFVSLYFFVMSAFIISYVFFSTEMNLGYSYLIIVTLLGSHMLRRSFQTIIENKKSFSLLNSISISVAIVISAISIWSFLDYQVSTIWLGTGLIIAFILITYTIEEKSDNEVTNVSVTNGNNKSIWNISLNLFLKNKFVRTPIIFGLSFKIIILTLDILIYSKSGIHFGNNLFIVFLFASPIIIFTYIFNNVWGYYKNYWFVIDQRLSGGKSIFKMYVYILWLPILVDMIISLTYLIISPSNLLFEGLVMYFISLITLTIGGFIWSMFNPSSVEQGLSFKVNTTILGSITSIIVVSSFMLLFISPWFYLIVPIYLILSVGIYLWMTSVYPRKRFYIFQNIYKDH